MVTDNKEHLIAAIKRNNDEKLAVFDKFSSQQFKAHEKRFEAPSKVSIKPVIQKKQEIELQQNSSKLNFLKQNVSQTIKELER